ncbi:MAG: peptidylprolyl isomerase [Bdellovibrionia bacterium]
MANKKNCKVLSTILALSVLSSLGAPQAYSKELAVVNDRKISDRDLTLSLSNLNEGQKSNLLKDTQFRKKALQALIDQEILAQEGKKLKLDEDADFRDLISVFEKQAMVNRLLERKLASKITPESLKKYYELHRDRYSTTQVHVQHILVSDEKEANLVKKMAQDNPGNFMELAKKHSKDPSVKSNQGDLGYVGHDKLVAEFTDAAFLTPNGKVTGPVKTLYGYHIIKVLDKKPGKPLEFAEVELYVRDALRNELVRDYTEQLRSQASIRVNAEAVEKL